MSSPHPGQVPAEPMLTLEEVQIRHVLAVFVACNGNKSQAAKVLGIDRRSVYRWIDKANAQRVPAASPEENALMADGMPCIERQGATYARESQT